MLISGICCGAYGHLLLGIETFPMSQVSLASHLLRNLPIICVIALKCLSLCNCIENDS